MKLHVQVAGSGAPLLILHGLFGTLENWGSQIKVLAEHFTVYAVDLRNHGRSPHSPHIDYPLMAADIIELMDDHGLACAHVLGHSMGGKVAMQLALNHPQRINQLIVVDIAPVTYPHHHQDVFAGLTSVDLAALTSRSAADQQLSQQISDPSVRMFLLKNLYRNEAKQFCWRMNLPALIEQYANISAAPTGQPYPAAMLFIKGGTSHYITAEHREPILALFPQAGYKIIQGAGHWPHAEKPDIFSKLVLNFLQAEHSA